MSDAPVSIYLQINPDWTPESNYPQFEGVTWSLERVNDSDVLYLRAPDPAELRAILCMSEYRCQFHGAARFNDCSECQEIIAIEKNDAR